MIQSPEDASSNLVTEEYRSRVSFCIPILVNASMAYDVSKRRTPEMVKQAKWRGGFQPLVVYVFGSSRFVWRSARLLLPVASLSFDRESPLVCRTPSLRMFASPRCDCVIQ